MAIIRNRGNAQAPTGTSTKSPDEAYMVVLDVRGNTALKPDGSRLFPITGYLPESFNMQFTSDWEAPLAQTTAGEAISSATGGKVNADVVNLAAGATGLPTRSKYQTFQVWSNSSAMMFSFDMMFHAQKDSDTEIRAVHRAMLKLTAPSEKAGALMPPGPTVTGQSFSADSQMISLKIGRYLYLKNVIITSVGSDVQSRFDAKGNPIALSIAVSISSFWTSFTAEDIDEMFDGIRGLGSGN